MVQFLTSLIEWLALVALSSVGIEASEPACAAASPAEYRTITATYYTEGGQTHIAIDARELPGCAGALARVIPVDDTPRLITELPYSYDS